MITIMSLLFEVLLPLCRPLPRLRAGAALFHTGDPVDRLHLVTEGKVQLVRHGLQGSPLILQVAGPGDILAEASIWSERHHCDGIAQTDAEVHALPRQRVKDLLPREDGLRSAYLSHLAAELRSTRLRAEILSRRTVAERLDAWLSGSDGALPPKGEWRHLAHEIAVTPEALYREIKRRRLQEA